MIKNKAYPYVRFSTARQESGDSIRRQNELFKNFSDTYNLELDESLNLNDYGESAYSGKNLESGSLGRFI